MLPDNKVLSYKEIPIGLPGQIASASIATTTAGYLVKDPQNLQPGSFMVAENDASTGMVKNIKQSKGSIQNNAFVGVLVENTEFQPSDSYNAGYFDGQIATVLIRGAVVVAATSDAQPGQYVVLKNADGAVVFDASPNKADHKFTGFRVKQGCKGANAGSPKMIVIESI